jgi:hypothetical protein
VHQKELKIKRNSQTELTLLEKVLQKELKIKEKFSKSATQRIDQAEIILPEEQ